jgi:drug/metabolite transporter (DMT)-like permease
LTTRDPDSRAAEADPDASEPPPSEPADASGGPRLTTPAAVQARLAVRWRERWEAMPHNTRGALWIIAGSLGFSGMAVIIKTLGETWSPFQTAFFRSFIGLLVLLPLVVRAGPSVLRSSVPLFHLWRGAAGVTAMLCGFYAFTHLPLATATAITFAKPLFMILVAVVLLGEAVRWRRWTATVVGFAGVLVMVRPGAGEFDPAMLVALNQALMIALAVAAVKKLPAEESNITVLVYFAVFSTAVTGLFAPFVWTTPTWGELGLAAAMGTIGVSSQAMVIRGFRIGEATAVSPFDYSRLIFAAGFGFVFFAEVPDLWTVLGALIIVVSTVYIAQREARLGRVKAGPQPH